MNGLRGMADRRRSEHFGIAQTSGVSFFSLRDLAFTAGDHAGLDAGTIARG